MIFDTTKEIGDFGEKTVVRFLKKKGYRIIEKNSHQSHNEIDIIVADGEYIAFVEVKTRTLYSDAPSHYGSAASAVTKGKQQRLLAAARQYLSKNQSLQHLQPRFDVAEVYLHEDSLDVQKINYIENAFGR